MSSSFVLKLVGLLVTSLLIAIGNLHAAPDQAVSAPISVTATDVLDGEIGAGGISSSGKLGEKADPPTDPLLESEGQSIQTPVNLLAGSYGVAVSPDGRHLYATAFLDDAVLHFNRDLTSGFLTYFSAVNNPGLNGAQLVAVSPDGEQVYVASAIAGTLTVFDRDLTIGFLTVADVFNTADVADLQGAYGVAVSPDGRFIYVTSTIQNAVIGFERMPDDSLVFRASNSDSSNIDLTQTRNLTVSPDGLHLYVTAEDAANSSSGNILVYQIDSLTGEITHVQTIHEGDLVGTRFFISLDGIGGAFDVVVSPDGANVYVVGTHDDTVTVFGRNATTGQITYRSQVRDGQGGVDGLVGVRGVDITPDGMYVVSAAYDDAAVAVFGRDPDSGLLSQVQSIYRGPSSPLLDGAADVVISRDGSNAYVGSFLDDAIVGFRAAEIFTDGFESGDTLFWSNTVP